MAKEAMDGFCGFVRLGWYGDEGDVVLIRLNVNVHFLSGVCLSRNDRQEKEREKERKTSLRKE